MLVELYADEKEKAHPERIRMNVQLVKNSELDVYKADVITSRPASDYTIRIISGDENISVPLENNLIAWQH